MRNAEFAAGIGRLWSRTDLPEIVADYVAEVRAVNPDGVLRRYPGSPQLAAQVLRPQDHLQLFELHSTESEILAAHFRAAGRRVGVRAGDGFAGLRAILPPPSRRGVALLDPSYELAADYRAVVAAVADALQRFATGTYIVWYPLLQRREAQELPARLRRMAGSDWLHVALQVKARATEGFGLHGSGLFVFNPPWKLAAEVRAVMPFLTEVLGQDAHAQFQLEDRES